MELKICATAAAVYLPRKSDCVIPLHNQEKCDHAHITFCSADLCSFHTFCVKKRFKLPGIIN